MKGLKKLPSRIIVVEGVWCWWKSDYCCIVQVVEPNKYWASMAVKGRIKINKLWLPNTHHYNERGGQTKYRTPFSVEITQHTLLRVVVYDEGGGHRVLNRQYIITVQFSTDYPPHYDERGGQTKYHYHYGFHLSRNYETQNTKCRGDHNTLPS